MVVLPLTSQLTQCVNPEINEVKQSNMTTEITSVTLNNGTVLEEGKTYEFDKFERGDYFTMVFIGKDKMAYQYNSDEIEHFISIDKRLLIIPYTAPQEEINWKTFLIEIDWNGYTSREIVQFESMEIAERHYNSAISIAEVKLNIEPVNS